MADIIWKGKSSRDIDGLIITDLPPITKPKMRTNKIEIDGRDGDIITELGYAAYDKQIEIGLYGAFDINRVIEFFTGEGKVTFSNESDKFYYYKIINQIDYEKLLKFKTAVVTFHCQPFKYPTTESTINLTTGNNTITNSGNIYAKPILEIVGSGNIEIGLGGVQILEIALGTNEKITIDVPNLEAYNTDDKSLMNRDVTGDYMKLLIQKGNNTLSITGTITSAKIKNYTRWI